MAAAARAAYFERPRLEAEVVESWQLRDCHAFSSASIQGYIANGIGFTMLAFRGSDHLEIDDWMGNADFDLVYDPHIRGGQVHSGFQRSADSIWPQIQHLSPSYRPPDHKLFLTGHSLGGALAMLTAARFASRTTLLPRSTGSSPSANPAPAIAISPGASSATSMTEHSASSIATISSPACRHACSATITPGQLRYIDENGVLHENISLWQQLLTTLNPIGKNAPGIHHRAEQTSCPVPSPITTAAATSSC